MQWLNDLQRVTTSPENAVRIMQATSNVDVTDVLPRVTVPTLVLHCRVMMRRYHLMKAARSQPAFRARNSSRSKAAIHLILEGEPAWQKFIDETELF